MHRLFMGVRLSAPSAARKQLFLGDEACRNPDGGRY